MRRRELQPSAFSKARHLESVDDDSSGHGDAESDPAQSSFFGSPLKESERDEHIEKYFILKYA